MFIRRASADGFILSSVKPATFEASIWGAYALLEPTKKGCSIIAEEGKIMLPACGHLQSLLSTARTKSHSKL